MFDIINVTDIRRYIGEEFSRPFEMAENLIRSNHIFDVRISEKGKAVEVFALCLRGSDVNENPRVINIVIKKDVSVEFSRS